MLEENERYKLILGDCLEKLKELPDNSVDAVVTDPPYGLGETPNIPELLKNWLEKDYMEVKGTGFMQNSWDAFVPQPILWKEVYRVLKPGGHLLSFFGTRTYDLGVMAIRLAGFEVRDKLAWIYSTGFPKSVNIGGNITKGTSEWEGWYSALKPAIEPIVVCRKPLSEKTIVENVIKWRTGGFNIDACRINGGDGDKIRKGGAGNSVVTNFRGQTLEYTGGRYPSNVILECTCDETKTGKIQGSQGHWSKSKVTGFGNFGDGTYNYEGVGEKESKECVVHTNPNCPCFIMDEQSGESYSSGGRIGNKSSSLNMMGTNYEKGVIGGASRFFYVAKASKTDRNDGLLVEGTGSNTYNKKCLDCCKWERKQGYSDDYTCHCKKPNWESPTGNIHTTVKPTKLMQQLVKLVTPPNGVVLDPFMGSGSTGRACLMEGFRFIGMELEEEYFKIAKQRVISKDEEVEEEKKQAVAGDIFSYMEED